MSKILIIANDYMTILHFRMEILQGLMDAGHQVIVAIPVREEAKVIQDLGCELVNIHLSRHGKNPLKDLKLMAEIRKIIRQHKPDLAITYTVKPNIYGSLACRMTKTPYLNNITGMGSILQSNSPLAKLMLFMMRVAFQKSSCVFFQNQENYRRFLEEKVISEKTPVDFLPGSGVNLEKFSYLPMQEKGPVKFVIVSRLRMDKGYAEFLDAAEQIKAKYSGTEFHILGWAEDENLKERVEALSEKGFVVYHGSLPQDEVHDIVASCTCLVHPSYHEGMANVILEAAATGRPVIASNISGCKEAVEDGKTGFLCSVKDPQSLAEAMEKIIRLTPAERTQMGKAGREKMEKEFNRDVVLNKLRDRIEGSDNALLEFSHFISV